MTVRVGPFQPDNDQIKVAAFAWRPRTNIPIEPEVAAKELDRIYRQANKLDAADVLERARDEKSPLHPAFEWEDGEAAEKFRLWQARNMLGALVVVYRKADGELTPPTRATVRLLPRADDPALDDDTKEALAPRTYIPINHVMGNAELRERYKRQAFLELVSWRQKYRDVTEFARLFEEIDRLKSEFKAS